MSINIERTPRTLTIGGKAVQVMELGTHLLFARKPINLDAICGGSDHNVYITETKELSPAEFDAFAGSLLTSRDWLAGKGGGVGDGYLCVEVTAPGRPYLYVNPEGSDYARYVAAVCLCADTIPATENEDWGFFGTMNENAHAAWPLAMTAISDATGHPLESVRTFLDSRHGRHFADDVLNRMCAGDSVEKAINAATAQWMTWQIDRATTRDYGIPKGMPYLTGFVIHCEISGGVPVTTFLVDPSNLNPNFTFANFVSGKANELVRAIGLQVAENPGAAINNPLIIVGDVGLGKTHLLQAIGNQVRKATPDTRIKYIHATDFVDAVVSAYRHKTFYAFKQQFHFLDVLLLDDIQCLSGRMRSQEEFLLVFNTLINSRKQIVVTSDRPVGEIEEMNLPLASRLASGMTVRLEPPDTTLASAILQAKAAEENVLLDDDVTSYVAQISLGNIRKMEGCLKRIVAHSRFYDAPMTLELVKDALREMHEL